MPAVKPYPGKLNRVVSDGALFSFDPINLQAAFAALLAVPFASAGENMCSKIKGVETLPEGSMELYQKLTRRSDKGRGHYTAYDAVTEIEYGVSNRLAASAAVKAQSIKTSGLLIEGYLPEEIDTGLELSGLEASLKYNFLSPALDDIGLSGYMGFDYAWQDKHSGQDKQTASLETALLLQKYLLEGQMVWVGNVGMEATYAKRDEIAGLPEDFEWPTDPEMELEFKLGTGLSYRFATNWSAGAEVLYETEFETEVGQERWSVFASPSLHYGSQTWWATLSWLTQVEGGGEQYAGQSDTDLHLIEKTKDGMQLKIGFNF